jgi:Leucine Rich repeat
MCYNNKTLPIFLALECLHISFIRDWLSGRTLGILDTALSSHGYRYLWLDILKSITTKAVCKWRHSHSSFRWLILRNIRVTQVLVSPENCEEVSDMTFEAVGINQISIALSEDSAISVSSWERCKCLDLGGCLNITDIGVSALSHGCGQLQRISLYGCKKITDVGVLAVSHGCGQPHAVNVSGCENITDIGVSALVNG